MKRALLLASLLPWIQIADAQNLVVNGSFEEYTECPDHWSQFEDNVVGWGACGNTPDYMNVCRDSSDLGVPLNLWGYQFPSEGDGYGGLITYKWNAPFYREYLCAPLESALNIGEVIRLSMKVAMGGYGSSSTMSARWTTRGIGIRLSTTPFVWPQTTYPNSAHLYLDEVLTDTASWTLLEGVLEVDSAYQYIAVGNFFEDTLAAPLNLMVDSLPIGGWAYVFIDEVCIAPSAFACSHESSIGGPVILPEWSAASPFGDALNVTLALPSQERARLELHDLDARLVATASIEVGQRQVRMDANSLRDGLFLLSLHDARGILVSTKVVHISP